MSQTIKSQPAALVDHGSDWTEFRKWIDGTYASLRFVWEETDLIYRIVANDAPFLREIAFNKGGSEQTDFEANFKYNRTLRPHDDFEVNYRVASITISPTFLMLIDLDNPSGVYKHTYTSGRGIVVSGINAAGVKVPISSSWAVFPLLVVAIDGSQADVVALRPGILSMRDTSQVQREFLTMLYPQHMDCAVLGGSLRSMAANTQVETGLNTAMTCNDVSGAARTPAVGDLILKVQRISGDPTDMLLLNYHLWYSIE